MVCKPSSQSGGYAVVAGRSWKRSPAGIDRDCRVQDRSAGALTKSPSRAGENDDRLRRDRGGVEISGSRTTDRVRCRRARGPFSEGESIGCATDGVAYMAGGILSVNSPKEGDHRSRPVPNDP